MPITQQQIRDVEARTGVKNIALRREYNEHKLAVKANEESFVKPTKVIKGGARKMGPNQALCMKCSHNKRKASGDKGRLSSKHMVYADIQKRRMVAGGKGKKYLKGKCPKGHAVSRIVGK